MALSLSTVKTAGRSRLISPGQSVNRSNLTGLSQMFKALPMASKGQWQLAANQINTSLGRSGRGRMSAANAFNTVNSARLSAGLGTVSVPLLPLTGPAAFGPLRLSGGSGTFHLALSTDTPVPNQIVVQAAPPVVAGKTAYARGAFRPIGTLGGLHGTADITALFTAKYGVPEPGSAIAVRLYAVSEGGLRGGDLIVTGLFLGASAASEMPEGDAMHLVG